MYHKNNTSCALRNGKPKFVLRIKSDIGSTDSMRKTYCHIASSFPLQDSLTLSVTFYIYRELKLRDKVQYLFKICLLHLKKVCHTFYLLKISRNKQHLLTPSNLLLLLFLIFLFLHLLNLNFISPGKKKLNFNCGLHWIVTIFFS